MQKIDFPKELQDKAYQALSLAKDSGKIKKGTNETTKAIERKQALLVAIASDVQPPEIVAHLSILCDEKDIPCIYVPRKEELGKVAGLNVPTASAAIVEAGDAKQIISDLATKLRDLKSGKKPAVAAEQKAEAPKVEKPKAETKPAEQKPKEAKPEKPKAETKPAAKKEHKKEEKK